MNPRWMVEAGIEPAGPANPVDVVDCTTEIDGFAVAGDCTDADAVEPTATPTAAMRLTDTASSPSASFQLFIAVPPFVQLKVRMT